MNDPCCDFGQAGTTADVRNALSFAKPIHYIYFSSVLTAFRCFCIGVALGNANLRFSFTLIVLHEEKNTKDNLRTVLTEAVQRQRNASTPYSFAHPQQRGQPKGLQRIQGGR